MRLYPRKQPDMTAPTARHSDAEFVARVQQDPVGWIETFLDVHLWEKQRELIEAVRDCPRVAARAGHGVGKSFAAACTVLWFLYAYYRSKVIITATTWQQVESVLWSEIRTRVRKAPIALGGDLLKTELRLADDWWARGLSTDDPTRFQGIHAPHMLVVFDEAPGVHREIWDAAEGSVSGAHARFLVIGNPTEPSGPFYDCFTRNSELWRCIHIPCHDHPNVIENREVIPGSVTRGWVDERRAEWGEGNPLYDARVLGQFPSQGNTTLIPLAWLDGQGAGAAASVGDGADGDDTANDWRLGCDIARYGADETVLLARRGMRVERVTTRQGADTMETTGRIAALARELKVEPKRVFVDEIGVGSGVVDRLHEQGLRVTGVNVGAGATDKEHFINLRAECYWRLRQALDPRSAERLVIGADMAALRAQLTGINYTYTSKGQIKIEEKEAIRKRTGRSPDHADALALTFAPEEAPADVWVL